MSRGPTELMTPEKRARLLELLAELGVEGVAEVQLDRDGGSIV